MVELNFIESLKSALDRLETVEDDMDKLKLEKDELRAKIHKWMEMHGLTTFESYNTDKSRLWKIDVSQRKRVNVNKDILAQRVSKDDYEEIVTESEYEVFTCKKIKQSKQSKQGTVAPKGSI